MKKLTNTLTNKDLDMQMFLSGFLDEFFFFALKEDFQQRLLRKKISLVLRVYFFDLVKQLSPFRIFCHLFYCKKLF